MFIEEKKYALNLIGQLSLLFSTRCSLFYLFQRIRLMQVIAYRALRNVSIKIPIATIKPNTNKSAIGIVVNAANVAAKITPADEMTPPVLRMAISSASFTEAFLSFFNKT